MKVNKFRSTAILLLVIVSSISCKEDFKLPYSLEKGTILGKEICQTDVAKDYWLINFDRIYGDSLTYKGVLYNHVVKTNQLDPFLKKESMRVLLGFDVTSDKMTSTNCNSISVETYSLRVLQLRSQGELR